MSGSDHERWTEIGQKITEFLPYVGYKDATVCQNTEESDTACYVFDIIHHSYPDFELSYYPQRSFNMDDGWLIRMSVEGKIYRHWNKGPLPAFMGLRKRIEEKEKQRMKNAEKRLQMMSNIYGAYHQKMHELDCAPVDKEFEQYLGELSDGEFIPFYKDGGYEPHDKIFFKGHVSFKDADIEPVFELYFDSYHDSLNDTLQNDSPEYRYINMRKTDQGGVYVFTDDPVVGYPVTVFDFPI